LVLKILGIVKTYLLNTHKSDPKYFASDVFKFGKWYLGSILGVGSLIEKLQQMVMLFDYIGNNVC
jgi:hypothetical protein